MANTEMRYVIGKNFRRLVSKAGYPSLKAFAEKAEINYSSLYPIWADAGNPSIGMLRDVAKALDMSSGDLVRELLQYD